MSTQSSSLSGRTFDMVGDRCTIKAGGADTGGAYALVECVAPPGVGTPPHLHRNEDEAFFVLDGELTCGTQGRQVTLRPGDFLHLKRGIQHWFRNLSQRPVRFLLIASPAGFENFMAEAGTAVSDFSKPPALPSAEQMGRLLEAAARHGIEIAAPA